jgi:hypothetical protein
MAGLYLAGLDSAAAGSLIKPPFGKDHRETAHQLFARIRQQHLLPQFPPSVRLQVGSDRGEKPPGPKFIRHCRRSIAQGVASSASPGITPENPIWSLRKDPRRTQTYRVIFGNSRCSRCPLLLGFCCKSLFRTQVGHRAMSEKCQRTLMSLVKRRTRD